MTHHLRISHGNMLPLFSVGCLSKDYIVLLWRGLLFLCEWDFIQIVIKIKNLVLMYFFSH